MLPICLLQSAAYADDLLKAVKAVDAGELAEHGPVGGQ
jgi:hypothetical protein